MHIGDILLYAIIINTKYLMFIMQKNVLVICIIVHTDV